MLGFTLDTFASTTNNVRLTAPVALPATSRIAEDIVVAGREGSLTRFTGWADVPITLELLIRKNVESTYAVLAKACLTPKRLTLSGQAGRFRMVKHAQVSPLVREGSWGRCTLDITCAPFAYYEDNPTHTLTPQAGTLRLVNPGLVQARLPSPFTAQAPRLSPLTTRSTPLANWRVVRALTLAHSLSLPVLAAKTLPSHPTSQCSTQEQTPSPWGLERRRWRLWGIDAPPKTPSVFSLRFFVEV